MSNTYFQFKQFTIHQDRCAMKVCTDACLFGAWTAEIVGSLEIGVGSWESGAGSTDEVVDISEGNAGGQRTTIHHILDIGSGTGLLALMLAQKTTASIETIEIESTAYQQATENVTASPWSSRIRVIHEDVNKHRFNTKFDFILSNPPFFKSQLRSPVPVINTARHESGLKWEELIEIADQNLQPTGLFAVLLPYQRSDHFITLAGRNNLHLLSVLHAKQSARHAFFRSLLLFGRQASGDTKKEELAIRKDDHYSPRFMSLLKDYYLHL